MRPPRVVVRRIQGKQPTEVPLSEDQDPVGDLCADGQHEAFGEAVRASAGCSSGLAPPTRWGIRTTEWTTTQGSSGRSLSSGRSSRSSRSNPRSGWATSTPAPHPAGERADGGGRRHHQPAPLTHRKTGGAGSADRPRADGIAPGGRRLRERADRQPARLLASHHRVEPGSPACCPWACGPGLTWSVSRAMRVSRHPPDLPGPDLRDQLTAGYRSSRVRGSGGSGGVR